MPDLIAMVEAMDPAEQAIAAKVLDACSRPLTAREIEAVLRDGGVAKCKAAKLANVLRHFVIIGMVGPEGGE